MKDDFGKLVLSYVIIIFSLHTVTATSGDCDLKYNGSCYKVFEVSTPINWLDARTKCAIWGGNLTSITTERENNYLNTIIPDTVSNYWIGLNDRDVEGTYTWIDGTAVNYTNWASTRPDNTNGNCVQINNAGNGMWESVSCDMTLNAFICKKDSSSAARTTVSKVPFTHEGTDFAFFQTSPAINQANAQTQCISWGGNLATIKSAAEDSLLLDNIPDLETTFTCHIGLNDIDKEAGTNGDAFVWIDGSTSSYRNWENLTSNYPVATNDNFDCVGVRYRNILGALSQGWVNAPCLLRRNCYFCSKPETINGCDLNYTSNSFYYKVFEVSTLINWLDAQSSCAIWGGDLASITTERENNYLNTLINCSVGNCWIGLNDREEEGTYSWIDGTAVNYTNKWDAMLPNVAASDCVLINRARNYMWEFLMCNVNLNSFLCKRNVSSTVTTVGRFGRITDGPYEFEELTGDTFFYEPLTLVCGSDGSPVEWRYSQNSDLSEASVLPETSNHVDFSWLYVNNTMQGYYRCTMSNAISHTVGVYDKTSTTVAVTETNYTYLVGVDRTDVLLLCDPEDDGSLSMLRWSLENRMKFFNPINLNSESRNLPDVSTPFSCKRGGVTLNTPQIRVRDPEIFVYYGIVPYGTYKKPINTLPVPSAVQTITLSINIEGKWNLPNNSNSSNSVLTIPNFSSQEHGEYKFYTKSWDDVEMCVIQIDLTTKSETTTENPDIQLTYNDTEFGFFDNSDSIDWYGAQKKCLNWGGNLATIKSAKEDSLLYYIGKDTNSSIDISECYIGLNNISNEAGESGSDFTWVDGSSNDYSKYGSFSNDEDRDCTLFRSNNVEDVNSSGWNHVMCTFQIHCRICSKSATSGYCDLIYDGSCYKVFEVITPINWLDAQSSCAIWGGNLTSITTERENNYLNTIIPNTVSSYWIGLNDRSEEDALTWIDGTTQTDINFQSILPNTTNGNCAQVNNTGNRMREFVNCTSTLSSFICEASSAIVTGTRFGELVNGGLRFENIRNNTILFNSKTLACGGGNNHTIVWKYSNESHFQPKEILATSSETGLSWLEVNISQQGYYQCQIGNDKIYMIELYDRITVAVDGSTFNYTVGVDRMDNLVLCNPNDDSIYLENLMWGIEDGDNKIYSMEYPNPADLKTVFSNVGGGVHTFRCFDGMSNVTKLSVQLALKDTAEITVTYQETHVTFSDTNNPTFPSPQEYQILVGTKDIKLTCNLPECVWVISYNEASNMDTYSIPTISESYAANISLRRMTDTNFNYTTAHILLTSIDNNLQTIYIVTGTAILLLLTALPILTLFIICFFFRKQSNNHKQNNDDIPLRDHEETSKQKCKRKPFNRELIYQNFSIESDEKFEQAAIYINDPNIEGLHGDQIASKPCSSSKSYINFGIQRSRTYMTIDETSMIPSESENDTIQQKYENIQKDPGYVNTSINSKTEMNPTMLPEENVPMSSVEEETLLFAKTIQINEFPAIYQQYVASGIEQHSLFSVEFGKLNKESKLNAALGTDEPLKAINKTKKLSKGTSLVFENHLVSDTPNFDCNYIKASYISENQFIASKHPTKETHSDFLQLIYQSEASMVIMLTTRREKARIISGISNRVCYWPNKDEPISCEHFITTLINTAETAAFVKREISLKNNADEKEHTFTQFISPIWNEDSTVAEMSSAVNLLIRIIKQSQDDPTKSIIIHCQDGISKTGILLSAISSVKELALNKTISIFNTVKDLRGRSIEMVPTLACYTTCYSLMNEYCSIHL